MTRLAVVVDDPGIAYGGPKGASVHVGELARALAEEGAEVLVLVTAVHERSPPPPPGVTRRLLPGPGKGAPVEARVAAGPARAAWLGDVVRRWRADAVYERVALHTTIAVAAAAEAGVPHVAELNAPLPEEAARYRGLTDVALASELEGRVLAGSDVVLAVTSPLADYAWRRGARQVEVCPNAVDPSRFRRPARAGAEPPSVVFTGRLRPWHGAATLAQAWELLGPAAPRLVVVGDGDGRDRLEAAGAHVTGTVPHGAVPGLLAAAQIGVVPYPADTPGYFSPLKLFEYLAAGLAVVGADLPGVRDIAGPATVLVPPGDAASLAAAVADLAADPARRAELGAAGRQTVLANHTWRHRARRILDLAGRLQRSPAVIR
jgi:glycosyltransferase involved in cell wall biosynthesis